jgi:hypothetical protein
MSTSWLDSSFLLLLGAAGAWFVMRFILGPKRGAPSLSSFFRREPLETVEGLGRKAIATLLDDTRAFVASEDALRGLLLAGPFATRSATITSHVTLMAICDAPETYVEPDWLLRWAYPARAHKVLEQRVSREPGLVTHHLTLRGAPPIEIHFLHGDCAAPPEAVQSALKQGLSVIDDVTGQAERLRRRWETLSRSPPTQQGESSPPAQKTQQEKTP